MAIETTEDRRAEGPISADSARFLQAIEARRVLPTGLDAAGAASAVMCTLFRRVSQGQARDYVDSLAKDLQALLRPCAVHREERGEPFGREQFIDRVADHLVIAPDQAEAITRAVFAAALEHLPMKEVDDIESQLPPDLKDLWRHPNATSARPRR